MTRYGIIVSEKADINDMPIHFMPRGTLVKFLSADEVAPLLPTRAVIVAPFPGKSITSQHIEPCDVIEITSADIAELVKCQALTS